MRVLLSSIEGGRRSRICMLLIEPPDFLHPLELASCKALKKKTRRRKGQWYAAALLRAKVLALPRRKTSAHTDGSS